MDDKRKIQDCIFFTIHLGIAQRKEGGEERKARWNELFDDRKNQEKGKE
jgi:hypothetical protein